MMEKLVAELEKMVPFKETTESGDLVLIVSKEPHMLVYGLVTDITPDTSRKDEWWHLEMTFLSIPPQTVTWTLRTAQMTGAEIFTMGGEERFVKAVKLPGVEQQPSGKSRTKRPGKPFLKRVK